MHSFTTEKEDKNNKKEVKKKFESKDLKVDHKCNDCERSFTKRCNLNRQCRMFITLNLGLILIN